MNLKHPFWFIGLILLVFVLVFSIQYTYLEKEPAATPPPMPTLMATLVPEPTPIPIGESINAGALTVKVNSAELPGPGEFFAPDEGHKIYKVSITLTNNTEEERHIIREMFACYANGIPCAHYKWRYSIREAIIPAAETIDIWLCYQVPNNMTVLELEYLGTYFKLR